MSYANEFPTKAHFYPVENLKIITPFSCIIGQELPWQQKYETSLNGIKPKIKVSTFSKIGDIVEATVGNPVCFKGECTANYVSLPLTSYMPLNDIIAVSKEESLTVIKLEVDTDFHACSHVNPPNSDPYNFGFKPISPRCKYLSWKYKQETSYAELVSFGWEQQNGWNIYQQYFRTIRKANDKIVKIGTLHKLTYSTHEFKPYFGFYDKDQTIKFIWAEFQGIGPVSAITFRESHITKDDELFWNSEYKAGGQPCD